jgi:hypothetical protein
MERMSARSQGDKVPDRDGGASDAQLTRRTLQLDGVLLPSAGAVVELVLPPHEVDELDKQQLSHEQKGCLMAPTSCTSPSADAAGRIHTTGVCAHQRSQREKVEGVEWHYASVF